jgi:O-antigen/teichoic acid export membrane protein
MAYNDTLSVRTLWNALGILVGAFGRMLAAIVVARHLGPELVGRYVFLTWLVEITILCISLGLPITLTRYLAEFGVPSNPALRAPLIRWVTYRYLPLSVIGAIVAYFVVQGWLSDSLRHEPAVLVSLLVLFQALSGLVAAYLAGLQDFRRLARINIFSSTVLLILQAAGSLYFGLEGALAGAVVSCLVPLLVVRAWKLPWDSQPREGTSIAPGLPRYALNTWLAALISTVVWGRIEIFFLDRYNTAVETGYYGVALTISMVVVQGAALLTGALMPHFASLAGRGAGEDLRRDYQRLTVIVSLFVFPVALGGAALMPELLPRVFGEPYRPAVPVAGILMACAGLAFTGVGSAMVYGLGESGLVFRMGTLGAAMMAAGCYLVIPLFGALGGAAVRSGVQSTIIVLSLFVLKSRYGMPFPFRPIGRIAVAASICALGAYTAMMFSPIFPVAAGAAAGLFVYIVAIHVIRPLPTADAEALAGVAARLPTWAARQIVPTVRWAFPSR